MQALLKGNSILGGLKCRQLINHSYCNQWEKLNNFNLLTTLACTKNHFTDKQSLLLYRNKIIKGAHKNSISKYNLGTIRMFKPM